jgi:GTP-binding protein
VKNLAYKNAQFNTTAVNSKGYPTLKLDSGEFQPEIAIAGRSNVGKSSLLNHLFHTKGLVKTSSTPGKTQAINFFTVDDGITFVDLPGYGYAQVAAGVRRKWGPMVQEYLEKREQLKLILFLFDIRRLPNSDDFQFLEWISHYSKPALLVLTKVDKLTASQKAAQTKAILAALGDLTIPHIHYSVLKNLGAKELTSAIEAALNQQEDSTHG